MPRDHRHLVITEAAYLIGGRVGWQAETRCLGDLADGQTYPAHIMQRTQIYLGAEQTAQLDRRARAEGVSRSVLIRRAIEAYLTSEDRDSAAWQGRWQEAVGSTAGVAPHLGDGEGYVEAIRAADARRLQEVSR